MIVMNVILVQNDFEGFKSIFEDDGNSGDEVELVHGNMKQPIDEVINICYVLLTY